MTGGSQAERHGRVIRKEQGWHLSVSRSGIGFRRFCYLYDDAAVVAPAHSASDISSGGRRLWLLPLLLGGGSIAAGVLAAPAVSTGHGYSVSLAVPDRAARAAGHSPRPAARRYAASAPRHRAVVADDDEADVAMGDTGAATVEALGADTNELAEQRYTDRAMRTGEMQVWQSDSVRYFLVAGDLQRADDKACRQFSLLARPAGGTDSVRHFERCRPAE